MWGLAGAEDEVPGAGAAEDGSGKLWAQSGRPDLCLSHCRIWAVLGWLVAPKMHVHLEPQNATLIGNRVFAGVVS